MNDELLIRKRTAYADYLSQCAERNNRYKTILNALEELHEKVSELFYDDDTLDKEQYKFASYCQALVAEHPSSKDAKVGDYVTCIVGNVTFDIKFGYSYKVTAISGDRFVFDEASMPIPASWFVLGITPQAEIFY